MLPINPVTRSGDKKNMQLEGTATEARDPTGEAFQRTAPTSTDSSIANVDALADAAAAAAAAAADVGDALPAEPWYEPWYRALVETDEQSEKAAVRFTSGFPYHVVNSMLRITICVYGITLDDLTNELCAFILPLVMVEMGSRCSFHSWTDQRRARAWFSYVYLILVIAPAWSAFVSFTMRYDGQSMMMYGLLLIALCAFPLHMRTVTPRVRALGIAMAALSLAGGSPWVDDQFAGVCGQLCALGVGVLIERQLAERDERVERIEQRVEQMEGEKQRLYYDFQMALQELQRVNEWAKREHFRMTHPPPEPSHTEDASSADASAPVPVSPPWLTVPSPAPSAPAAMNVGDGIPVADVLSVSDEPIVGVDPANAVPPEPEAEAAPDVDAVPPAPNDAATAATASTASTAPAAAPTAAALAAAEDDTLRRARDILDAAGGGESDGLRQREARARPPSAELE